MRDLEATIRFSYPSSGVASTVERAIRLDVGDIEGERSTAGVRRDGETVVVTIESDDPSALRAAKRTWCGLVGTAERTAAIAR